MPRPIDDAYLRSLALLAIFIANVLGSDHRSIYAEFNKDGEISSPGFPDSCCTAFSFSIQMILGGDEVGYIRMVFSDLDLPKGSKLQIYDGVTASSQNLFPNQPELRRGVWSRPSISSSKPGGAIHVKFTPPLTTNSSAYTVNFTHTGFKASYWVTNSPPENWHDKALPDVCKPIVSPLAGEEVIQKTIDYGDYHGTTIDCVWQLKVPTLPAGSVLKQENLEVYLRVETLDFQHGYLDIIRGISSEGVIIQSLDSETDDTRNIESLQQSAVGYVSSEGLYIHLTMLNEGRGVFRFVYGLRHKQHSLMEGGASPYACDFGDWGVGFTCSQDEESWCIPPQNKCNHASNCPNGEDEEEEKACPPEGYLPPTTTTSTTTTEKIIADPISTYQPSEACKPADYFGDSKMCNDWNCDEKHDCQYNGGLKCPDSRKSIWCPGQGCISQYALHYSCNGYCKKCPDGTCSLSSKCPGVCPALKKKCGDGSCISYLEKCPGECEVYETKCSDGSCRSYSYQCPGDPCSSSSEYKCDSGDQCYNSYDKCDGYTDCWDGTDERNCPSSRKRFKTWTLLILIPIAVFAIICICIKMQKKSSSESTREPDVQNRTAYHSIVSRRINSGSTGFTGTRMTPVTTDGAPPGSRRGSRSPLNHGNHVPSHAPEPTAPPPVEASAPPPSYTDVMEDESTYQRPSTDGQVPPPSYYTVTPDA